MSDVQPLPPVGDAVPLPRSPERPSPDEAPAPRAGSALEGGTQEAGVDALVPPRTPGPRIGELVAAWRAALVLAWAGAFFAYMGVWKASEEIGIATWWLGPSSNPQPVVIRLIPFVACATCGAISSFRIRHVSLISIVGAAVLGAIAVPDFSRSVGLAVVEVVIAVAVGLVALMSLTGRYRAPQSHAAEPDVTRSDDAGSDVAG